MEKMSVLKEKMKRPMRCVIITHAKPDADAMGSSLGLAIFLQKKGHQVQVVTPTDYPTFLNWLPGNDQVLSVVNEETRQQAEKNIMEAELLFCLDFSSLQRVHNLSEPIKKTQAFKVVIDHHLDSPDFANYTVRDTKSASTAGLIYEWICWEQEIETINPQIATCLYAGLIADTGGFSFPSTRSQEFEIAADLVRRGSQPSQVAQQLWSAHTIEKWRLTGHVLLHKLTILPQYRTAYITLSQQELHEFRSALGDTEGLVNYGLAIKDVVMSVFLVERIHEIKLSFRSVGTFSVNDFANKHFSGGGHYHAAGGSSSLSLEDTEKKLITLLADYANSLQSVTL